MIRVVHQLRGRARFEVPGLRGFKVLARVLERELLRSAAITRVSASSVTGKVLVLYSEAETSHAVAILIDKILNEFPETLERELPWKGTGMLGGPCRFPGQSVDGPCVSKQDLWAGPSLEENGEAWHTMEPEAVVHHLETSLSTGLTEVSVREHRARFGGNALPGTETRPIMEILQNQAASLPVALIGVAAGLSVLTGGLVEGLIMLGVAALNVVVGSLTEHQAEGELKTARGAVDLRARVLRSGRIEEIPFDEVVMGDVLSLQAGSRIPADARVVHAKSLALDEASLTGESLPVYKTLVVLPHEDCSITERRNMVYRGTLVVEGTGRAVVVATGQDTVLGKLQRFLGEVFPPEALMAQDLKQIAHRIIQVGAAGSGILTAVSLVRGHGLLKILGDSIALFAGSIPTGLSTLAISAFALGHRDLRRNRILVRRLRALGSLASIRVVCLDKTGTLTHNRMTATELCAGNQRIRVRGDAFTALDGESVPETHPDVSWLIRLSALCNEAHVADERENQSLEGSGTEKSLLRLAELAGLDVDVLRGEHPIIEIEHRTEEHPFMVTVHRWGEGGFLKAVKGSPPEVLERCSHYALNGEALVLGDDERDAIDLENLKMAGAGLRVLGVAYSVAYSKGSNGDSMEDPADQPRFVWVGLVGLQDPLREEAKPLIRALHRAGIRTTVITGDQSFTAQHIGNELRLSGDAPLQILDSSDLRRLDADGTRSVATRAHVFARLNPTQKLQVIQAYQNAGMSVAMVGDGLNDVLALKVADVGIAMGKEGSALARGSADLVLEDDDLQSVMFAIATGRAFYRNMRKSIRFLLTAHHVDVLMGLSERAAGIGHGPGPTQGLWTNLMCLSLALDPSGLCYTDEGPVDPEESLMRTHDMEATFLDATQLMVGSGVAGAYGALRHGPGREAGRLFMQSVSINQLLYGIQCREKDGEKSTKRPSNPLFELTLMGAVGSHLLSAILPGIGKPIGAAVSRLLDALVLGAGGLLTLSLLRQGTNQSPPVEPLGSMESDKS